jgi:predicted pyridoxine 5'-phosphate oxidase superfamily flavin-nucleotide-binding protein
MKKQRRGFKMKSLPEEISQAWENRENAIVLTTVDKEGNPNSIYATCVGLYENKQIVIADNYFEKTRRNILGSSLGSVLFITKEGKAYQVKGTFEYVKEGPVFEFMKSWNPEKHPGHAAAVLNPQSVYSGAQQIC